VKGLHVIQEAYGHLEHLSAIAKNSVKAKARSLLEPNFDYAPIQGHQTTHKQQAKAGLSVFFLAI
jgi:hypothetical protein